MSNYPDDNTMHTCDNYPGRYQKIGFTVDEILTNDCRHWSSSDPDRYNGWFFDNLSQHVLFVHLRSSHNQNLDGDIDISFYTSPLYIIVKNLWWKFFLWEILILKLIKDRKENALWLILVWDWNTIKPEIDETLLLHVVRKLPGFPYLKLTALIIIFFKNDSSIYESIFWFYEFMDLLAV